MFQCLNHCHHSFIALFIQYPQHWLLSSRIHWHQYLLLSMLTYRNQGLHSFTDTDIHCWHHCHWHQSLLFIDVDCCHWYITHSLLLSNLMELILVSIDPPVYWPLFFLVFSRLNDFPCVYLKSWFAFSPQEPADPL